MTEYADFSVYVATRWPRLVRTAILLGCSPAEAEDVTQAALEKCFVHWSKVEAADDRDAYVHRILINTFNSSRRQRRWRAEHSTDRLPTVAQPDHSSSVASSAALRAALMRLSPEQRAVVVLRYYAQLSESETCQALAIPAGTAKSRLARALVALAADSHLTESRGEQ